MLGLLGLSGIAATSACSPDATATSSPSSTASTVDAPRPTATSTTPPAPSPSGPSTPPAQPSGSGPRRFALGDPGPDIATGPTAGSFVALTFHGAGDLALTTRALAIAHDTGAALTVFAVGQWLDANPSIGADITHAGNDLGNHTWSHQQMPGLDLAQATREIRLGSEAVTRSIGGPGLLFRPSGTPASTPTIRAAAAACGYPRCVSYDVDPLDYTDPGAELVRTRTLTAVKAGSIVSLHLGHAGTIEALPGILAGLAHQGLTPVTLTRMLATAT